MLLTAPSVIRRGTSLINAIGNLGLTSGLKLCLDAGDANSYGGSSQTWKDLSGNGTDFYRGSGSGADGADPTFNGSAGNQSSNEYFGADGGDYFTLASANPSWLNAIHKSGGKFTIAEWQYLSGIVATSNPFGNAGSASTTGAGIVVGSSTSTNLAYTVVVTGDSNIAYAKKTTALASNGQWNYLAVSVDINAGAVIFCINGTVEAYTSQSFSGLSSSAASQTLTIGSEEGSTSIDNSGCRWAQFSMWDVAQSAANLTALFNATRQRFGT